MKEDFERIVFGEELSGKQKKILLVLGICLVIGAVAGGLIWQRYQKTAKWEFPDGSLMGYDEIIFVGDSRTVQMEGKNENPNLRFVGKNGSGLDWFKNEGYDQLENLLSGKTSPRPTALVFNFGINDYKYNTPSRYIKYFKKIARGLKDQNCYLFYMSVNPVEEEKILQRGEASLRTNKEIENFNRKMKKGLAKDYVWLDLCSDLTKHGYATLDGLHFTGACSVYILNRSVQLLLETGAYPQSYFWGERGGSWYAARWSDNRKMKGWIQDGAGFFYLDEQGRLLKKRRMKAEDGRVYLLGATGRRSASEAPEDAEAV